MIRTSAAEPDTIQKHFDIFFDCTTELDGDIFLASTDADAQEEREMRRKLAATQGVYMRDGSSPSVLHRLSPCEQRHFKQYQGAFDSVKPGEPFISHLSQNLDARRRCGRTLRAQCTSSLHYSYSQDRLFSARAARRAHGWPVQGSKAHDLYGECLPHDLESAGISLSRQQLLLGQGMHLGEVGAGFLHVMSHVLRRDVVMAMMPVPRRIAVADVRGLDEA